jgi:hypothetical protein
VVVEEEYQDVVMAGPQGGLLSRQASKMWQCGNAWRWLAKPLLLPNHTTFLQSGIDGCYLLGKTCVQS